MREFCDTPWGYGFIYGVCELCDTHHLVSDMGGVSFVTPGMWLDLMVEEIPGQLGRDVHGRAGPGYHGQRPRGLRRLSRRLLRRCLWQHVCQSGGMSTSLVIVTCIVF